MPTAPSRGDRRWHARLRSARVHARGRADIHGARRTGLDDLSPRPRTLWRRPRRHRTDSPGDGLADAQSRGADLGATARARLPRLRGDRRRSDLRAQRCHRRSRMAAQRRHPGPGRRTALRRHRTNGRHRGHAGDRRRHPDDLRGRRHLGRRHATGPPPARGVQADRRRTGPEHSRGPTGHRSKDAAAALGAEPRRRPRRVRLRGKRGELHRRPGADRRRTRARRRGELLAGPRQHRPDDSWWPVGYERRFGERLGGHLRDDGQPASPAGRPPPSSTIPTASSSSGCRTSPRTR